MNSDLSENLNKARSFCSNCHKTIKKGEAFYYHTSVLCEDCCIDMHTSHVRKTHWQPIFLLILKCALESAIIQTFPLDETRQV